MKEFDLTGWTQRLGSDLLRNLIAEESRTAHGLRLPRERPISLDTAPVIQPLPNSSSLCSHPLGATSGRICESVLVFQAGRLFLVGPTRVAVEAIMNAAARGIAEPKHLVLLNWDEDHLSGLETYVRHCIDRSTPLGLTIWTSDWIWEEVYLSADAGFREKYFARFEIVPADVLSAGIRDGNEVRKPFSVVTFGRELNLGLTAGVRLHAYYTPAEQPSLAVSFECSHLEIHLEPMGAISAANVTIVKDSLIRSFQPGALMRMAFVRYGELEMREDSAADTKFSSVWCAPQRDLGWYRGDSVILSTVGKSTSEISFRPEPTTNNYLAPMDIAECPAAADPFSKLCESAVVLLCGGVRGQERDLIGPERVINVTGFGGGHHLLSVIEWRLRQIDALAKRYSANIPVILVVSPETEAEVRVAVSRYVGSPVRQYSTVTTPHLEIVMAPQGLVPVMSSASGVLQPIEQADGGWKLLPAGHFDAIQILWHWSKSEAGRTRKHCVLFPHNNFGSVVSPQTLDHLALFSESEALAGFESFGVMRSIGDQSLHWDLMSYTRPESGSRLFKRLDYPDTSDQTPQRFSSMTWYLNLESLRGLDIAEIEATKFIVSTLSSPTRKGIQDGELYHLRRDLDQLSHCSAFKCLELQAPESNLMFGDTRFLIARNEDDIRSAEFRDLFEASAKQQPVSVEPEGDPLPGNFLVLPQEAMRMDFVWGGDEIAKRKGILDYHRFRVAETREVSTHPGGQSAVHLSLRRSAPLGEIVGDLDYMAKYLDCQGALSLQIHPSSTSAGHMWEKCINGTQQRLGLSDRWGKEESFLVLASSASGQNLIIGFDRAQLSELANIVHPDIVRSGPEFMNAQPSRTKEGAVEPFLRSLAKNMGVAAERYLVGPVGDLLGNREELIAECRKMFEVDPGTTDGELYSILRYHTFELPAKVGSAELPYAAFGKEYLFAAVAIIRAIECIVRFVDGKPQKTRLLDLLRVGSDDWDQSPIYRFFHRVRVEPGNWVRIPAGVLHAWQGGGNFLIELSGRSDNTFRILDYGRELSDEKRQRRPMHYTAAMYSVSEESVVTPDSVKRLIFPAVQEGTCQAGLGYWFRSASELGKGEEGSSVSEEGAYRGTALGPATDCYSVLMNPDNRVQIEALGLDGRAQQITLPSASSAVIGKGVALTVKPHQDSDRLLRVAPIKDRPNLLCISLGGSKIELALWRDRETPSIVWHRIPAYSADGPRQRGLPAAKTVNLIKAICPAGLAPDLRPA